MIVLRLRPFFAITTCVGAMRSRKVDGAMSTDDLRRWLSARGVPYRYQDADKTWQCFDREDLVKIKGFVTAREEGEQRHKAAPENRLTPSTKMHTFWSHPDPSKWDNVAVIDGPAQVGLHSMLRLGCDVTLYTYHPGVVGVPEDPVLRSRLHVEDANILWPRPVAALHLQNGWWDIQHVSDFCRGLAVQRFPGADGLRDAVGAVAQTRPRKRHRAKEADSCHSAGVAPGAWLADLDNIFIRPFGRLPSMSGHMFCTMTGTVSEYFNQTDYEYKVKPIRWPGEKLWISTPWYFPAGSPVLTLWMQELHSRTGRKLRGYNVFMQAMLGAVHSSQLHVDFVDQEIFNPIAPQGHQLKMFKAKSDLARNFDKVLRRSIAVCQYWSSTKNCALAEGRTVLLEKGSFYWQLLEHVGLAPVEGEISRGWSVSQGRAYIPPLANHSQELRGDGCLGGVDMVATSVLVVLVRSGFWVHGKSGSPLGDVEWLATAIVSRQTLRAQMDAVRAWWALEKAIQRGALQCSVLNIQQKFCLASQATLLWRKMRSGVYRLPRSLDNHVGVVLSAAAAVDGGIPANIVESVRAYFRESYGDADGDVELFATCQALALNDLAPR